MLLKDQIDEIVGSYSEMITLEKNGQTIFHGSITSLLTNRKDLLGNELLEELSFCVGKGYVGFLK